MFCANKTELNQKEDASETIKDKKTTFVADGKN
jgi:hypothetical protein